MEIMEAKEIIKNILPRKSAYERTLYLLYNYRDLKNGMQINEESREVKKIIDQAVRMINEEQYIVIIHKMLEGKTVEEISIEIPLEIKSVYRHRRRLIKRLSIILFGDLAL